jgi:rhodanese-related sulfurtransferase
MIAQVRPVDLSAWLEAARAHGEPVVLDVREPHELHMARVQSGRFSAAHHSHGRDTAAPVRADPEQPIACLCHHGGRSMQVAHFLASRGFRHVANIAGGINAWSAEVDPSIPRY